MFKTPYLLFDRRGCKMVESNEFAFHKILYKMARASVNLSRNGEWLGDGG